MKELLSIFVDALRQELQQYGEILARLDQEQAIITNQGPQAILSSIAAVNAQTQVIEESRRHRLAVQREVATRLGCAEESPLLELLPLLPTPHNLLISALVAENDELLERIRERAEQNHLKLKQSAELMYRVVGKLSCTEPGVVTLPAKGQQEIAEIPPVKAAV